MTSITQQSGLIRQVQAGAVPLSTMTGVVLAVLFGAFLIFGVGLLGADVLHNAAHDVRHGLSFPCH